MAVKLVSQLSFLMLVFRKYFADEVMSEKFSPLMMHKKFSKPWKLSQNYPGEKFHA